MPAEPPAGDPRLLRQARYRAWLLPASYIYGAFMAGRRWAYRTRLLRPEPLSVPIISVGSLIAGGAGKTPLVRHLMDRLADHGWAVLSRGYGGTNVTLREVTPAELPVRVGDEPLLLRRSGTGDVWVARDRALAAAQLQSRYRGLILEDGFQHLRLGRDLNICLVPDIPYEGVLPAGLWREFRWAVKDADLVVTVDTIPAWLPGYWNGPTARVSFRPGRWRSVDDTPDPPVPVAGVCGIARPERFFDSLDVEVAFAMSYPDHHAYTSEDWSRIQEAAQRAGAKSIVTTAKDAVRMEAYAGRPGERPLFWRDVQVHWQHGEDMLNSALRRIGIPETAQAAD